MSEYKVDSRNKVKRIPKRGYYDEETVYKILDSAYLCHVGFNVDSQPFVIPTSYGRDGDWIYLHGATTSRMMKELATGMPACLTVTHLDGLVLARSTFHHSMNYRSAVVFGTATLVDNEEKLHALEVITENILKGRWEESRQPNAKELKATSVVKLKIEQASAKIRTGPPGDEKEDYELPIWAGVVPISLEYGKPIADEVLPKSIQLANSVEAVIG